jgi:hypothetical protein
MVSTFGSSPPPAARSRLFGSSRNATQSFGNGNASNLFGAVRPSPTVGHGNTSGLFGGLSRPPPVGHGDTSQLFDRVAPSPDFGGARNTTALSGHRDTKQPVGLGAVSSPIPLFPDLGGSRNATPTLSARTLGPVSHPRPAPVRSIFNSNEVPTCVSVAKPTFTDNMPALSPLQQHIFNHMAPHFSHIVADKDVTLLSSKFTTAHSINITDITSPSDQVYVSLLTKPSFSQDRIHCPSQLRPRYRPCARCSPLHQGPNY